MRLSHVHALFMASRKLSEALALTIERPSVDAAVNAHAAPDTRSTIPLALSHPGNVARRTMLRVLASDPPQGGRKSRASANARKWLKRLENADALAWWLGRAGLTGDALRDYDLAPRPRDGEGIAARVNLENVRFAMDRMPHFGGKLQDRLNQTVSYRENGVSACGMSQIAAGPRPTLTPFGIQNIPKRVPFDLVTITPRRFRKG